MKRLLNDPPAPQVPARRNSYHVRFGDSQTSIKSKWHAVLAGGYADALVEGLQVRGPIVFHRYVRARGGKTTTVTVARDEPVNRHSNGMPRCVHVYHITLEPEKPTVDIRYKGYQNQPV